MPSQCCDVYNGVIGKAWSAYQVFPLCSNEPIYFCRIN